MNNTTGGENGTMVLFDLYSSMGKIIGYSLAYGILASVGLVGNILVLIVVFMNKSMRTAINVLLVNLSISDILFIALTGPGFLATEICNQRWLLGLGMAIISQLFTVLCAAASVFTLMAIAFERYFAIVHPLKNRTRDKKFATISGLAVIWICSTAFALPFGIGTKLKHIPHNVKQNGQIRLQEVTFLELDMDVNMFKIYYVSIFVGLHVVPFIALVIMYLRIAWTLWHPERQLAERPAGEGANERTVRMNERNRRRTTIMVIAVLLAFFVCFFPFHIYFINELFEMGEELKYSDENSILRVLLLLNAALNPIIYNLLSENFRAGFREILRCCPLVGQEIRAADGMDTLQTAGN